MSDYPSDELSPASGPDPSTVHPAPLVFKRGAFYECKGPQGEDIVVMSKDTWVDFNTGVESLRQMARSLDRKLNEVTAMKNSLEVSYADTRRRLDNLRAIRRDEKRAELEKELNIPTGDDNG